MRSLLLILASVLFITSCSSGVEHENALKRYSRSVAILAELNQHGKLLYNSELGQLNVSNKKDLFGADELTSPKVRKSLSLVIDDLKSISKTDQVYGDASYFLGVVYLNLNDKASAIDALKSAIIYDSKFKTAYLFLFGILVDQKDFKSANDVIDKYSVKYPDEKFNCLVMRGTLSLLAGDYHGAIGYGSEIEKLSPDQVAGFLLVANANYLLGKNEIAESRYREIVRKWPEMTSEIQEIKENLNKVKR